MTVTSLLLSCSSMYFFNSLRSTDLPNSSVGRAWESRSNGVWIESRTAQDIFKTPVVTCSYEQSDRKKSP